ncbi:hypothetical protein SCALM49S_00880 [Streptomyces californicus]
MCPDTPSSYPSCPNSRNAPASRSLRYARSSSGEACTGGIAKWSCSTGIGAGAGTATCSDMSRGSSCFQGVRDRKLPPGGVGEKGSAGRDQVESTR